MERAFLFSAFALCFVCTPVTLLSANIIIPLTCQPIDWLATVYLGKPTSEMEGRGGYFCFEEISDWPMSMISNTSLCYVCILLIEKAALFVIKTSYLLWKVTLGFPNMNIILFLGAWRLSHNLDRCHNSLILQYYNTIVLERSCLEKQDM